MLAYSAPSDANSNTTIDAKWWIWPPECKPSVPPGFTGDPVDDYAEKFWCFIETGYMPWLIQQKQGNAVYIPPSHLYQVSINVLSLVLHTNISLRLLV